MPRALFNSNETEYNVILYFVFKALRVDKNSQSQRPTFE